MVNVKEVRDLEGEKTNLPFWLSPGPTSRGRPRKCVFRLIPAENPEDPPSGLANLIAMNGGDILYTPMEHDYVITLLNEKWFWDNPDRNRRLPSDTYSSLFVHKFVRAHQQTLQMPDLNDFRLSRSKFEPYDVNSILRHEVKWSDLVVRKDKNQKASKIKAQHVILRMKAAMDQGQGQPRSQPIMEVDGSDQQEEILIVPESRPESQKVSSIVCNGSKSLRSSSSDSESEMEVYYKTDDEDDEEPVPPKFAKKANLLKLKLLCASKEVARDVQESCQISGENANQINQRDESPPLGRSTVQRPPTPKVPDMAENEISAPENQGAPAEPLTPIQPPRITETSPPQGILQRPTGDNSDDHDKEDTDSPRSVPIPGPSKQVKSMTKLTDKQNVISTSRPTSHVLPIKLVPKGLAGPTRAVIPVPKTSKQQQANQASSNGDDDLSSMEDISYPDDEKEEDNRSTTSSRFCKGRPFSKEEGQEILNIVCENDAFLFTKGLKFWKLVEQANKFPGRTAESLKEHYKKKVHPNALKALRYRISPEHLKRLQRAVQKSEFTKYANRCPDFLIK